MVEFTRRAAIAFAAVAALLRPRPVLAANAHDFAFRAIDGGDLPLARFKGSAVMIVNTASQCGFTKQYANLQELWQRYRDRGLIVLGVPSNDFGGQEPGSEAEIKKFCAVNFAVDFPLAAKEVVKGDGAHPFYKWAAAEVGMIAVPRWNFHKYLIGPDGRIVDWFSTPTDPLSSKVTEAIEAVLPSAQSKRQ